MHKTFGFEKDNFLVSIMMKISFTLLVDIALVSGFAFQARNDIAVRRSTKLNMAAALIIQNKGGGHGELGFQLAKKLLTQPEVTSITILQDEACKIDKEPFKSYSTDIPDVKVIKAALGDETFTADMLQGVLGTGASYEYVWDNASKGASGAGKAVIDCAKAWNSKILTYVSSAGIYQPTSDTTFPMTEDTPIKDSAGQAQYEAYATQEGLPLVSFRPQYIYGPKSNKFDYIDWYFDRLVRELPLPIPADGTQKVSLTNSEDVASLLCSVLNNPEAAILQRYFNCGTDELLSYDQVAYLCAEVAGIPKEKVMIEHYDADLYGKAKFPFRMTDFYVSPDQAKAKLGWEGPKHKLVDDLVWYYENYLARGGPTKKLDLGKDWEIVVGSKSQFHIGSIYDKYDPLVVDMSNIKQVTIE